MHKTSFSMIREGRTANGKYEYSSVRHGRTLLEWVEGAHAHLSQESGWSYRPLNPHTFGFDNMACSLMHVFKALETVQCISLEDMASHIHEGWIENYTWWRDEKPWLLFKNCKAPYNPLGDERREKCASLPYKDLPPDEQEKDRIIARYILSKLG